MNIVNIFMSFLIAFFFNVTWIDYVLFVFTAGLCGYNLFYFFQVFFDFRGKQAREEYFNASVIGAAIPTLVWPFFMVFYFFHSLLYVGEEEIYPSASFATFKLFLSFLWNVIAFFFVLECLFPMYEWW